LLVITAKRKKSNTTRQLGDLQLQQIVVRTCLDPHVYFIDPAFEGGDGAAYQMLTKMVVVTEGCGQLLPVVHGLAPATLPARVFTLQLGWEKEREDAHDVRATMATITEVTPPPPNPTTTRTMIMHTPNARYFVSFVLWRAVSLWRRLADPCIFCTV